MGWWKCNDNGGIDWGAKPEHGTLLNAIPGEATTENYYNGDSPADAMAVPEAIIKSWFVDRPIKPTYDQMVNLIADNGVDEIFNHVPSSKIETLVKAVKKEIDAIYIEAWNRPPYMEERVLVCRFTFGWVNHKFSGRDWEMSQREKKLVQEYEEGKFPYWWRTA